METKRWNYRREARFWNGLETSDEIEYIRERDELGWQLVSVCTSGEKHIYYWKKEIIEGKI